MNKAIFLDRDGVVIENVATYVRSWADVEIFPGALAALARLRSCRYKIVIVTNQSAVGRGVLPLDEAQSINHRLIQEVEKSGSHIDGLFMCPHAPSEACDCRKPKPGLLLQAASALDLDLSRSILVGDALTDIQAGQNAKIPTTVLVRTGRGSLQSVLPEAHSLEPFPVYDRLEDVVEAILRGLLS